MSTGDSVTPTAVRWWGTFLYVPILYGLGWLGARPLGLIFRDWKADQVDLAGVAIALLLLLVSLPKRVRLAWGSSTPWRTLGVQVPLGAGLLTFTRGLLKAVLLLTGTCLLLLLSGNARWVGSLAIPQLLNAMALTLGVGFAEELLFRGWLWGELRQRLGAGRAVGLQAAIFALLHPWYRLKALGALALLAGLVMLGLALALQRRSDAGSLWGAIGLHGGLVGGWFALKAGLLSLSPSAPAWLIGPGGGNANPIGSLAGWLGLGVLLLARRRHWPGQAGAL